MGQPGNTSRDQPINNSVDGLLSISSTMKLKILRPSKAELPRFFIDSKVVDYAHGRNLSTNREYSEALAQAGFPRKARVLLEDIMHGITYVTSMRRVGNRYYIYIPRAVAGLYNRGERVSGFVTLIEVIER